ncbi:MAG: hypothetical protein CL946_13495, partial [Ectothiorhodospiraceae bacterium]|nr:hypothetical protein [Ectothiorhodospiraceae bacterium]
MVLKSFTAMFVILFAVLIAVPAQAQERGTPGVGIEQQTEQNATLDADNRAILDLHPCIIAQLSDEEEAHLMALIRRLIDNGATRDEVHTAVQRSLKSWDVKPCGNDKDKDRRINIPECIWDKLSERQAATLKSMIERMLASDMSVGEIQKAVHEQLRAWEIGPCEGDNDRPVVPPCIWEQLSERQAETLRTMIARMMEARMNKADIIEAVHRQLEAWEIGPCEGDNDRPVVPPCIWEQLSERQAETLRTMIARMME